jgi:broad specificity phosphatase PhoE
MHLIIVRHGQSTGNVTTDDVPDGTLTPLGCRQAQETAACLAGVRITHVLSSPLVRALATGTAIAEAAGVEHVEVWPELQEHRTSVHRGFGRAELMGHFPKAVFPESVAAEGWDHGGETYESALERGVSAIAALRARHHATDRLVVATHGAFACYMLRAILRVPPQSSIWFRMNNCGIIRVEFYEQSEPGVAEWYENADAEIICVNDVSHISEVS